MRFTLCFLLASIAAPSAVAAQSPTESFRRGEAAWQRSCAKDDDGLCVERRTKMTANTCSGESRIVRVKKRKRSLVVRAKRELERAGELAGARFYLAEMEMERLLAIGPLPALDFDPKRPKRTERDKKRFLTWIEKLKAALGDTNKAYSAVVGDARFRVAAAARLSQASARFAEMLADAPIPRSILRHKQYASEMRQAYCEALDDVAKPLRARARTAAEHCVELAKETRVDAVVAAKCPTP